MSPRLSIVIPAYNEQRRLPPTLDQCLSFLEAYPHEWELIIVNDGSADRTSQVVQEYHAREPRVRLLDSGANFGKGHAVKSGMLASRGELRLFMDADGATHLREVLRLLDAMDRTGAEVAFGSRALGGTQVRTRWYRKLPGRIFNLAVNLLILPGIADTQCGFKLFTARAADAIFPRQTYHRFSFDLELLYLARRQRLGLVEVPVDWTNIPGSKVNVLRDGMLMLRDAINIRLAARRGVYD